MAMNEVYSTELHEAALNGRLLQLRRLLSNENVNVNVLTEYQESPLHFACMGRNVKCAQVLIEAGVELNRLNIRGQSPLYYGCKLNDPDCCKLLLQHGATDTNESCLRLLIYENSIDCIREFVDNGLSEAKGLKPTLMVYTCINGTYDSVKLLLKAGVKMVHHGVCGVSSALHTAALHNKRDLISLLLKFGANLYLRDECKATAKNVAFAMKNECYEHLLEAETTPKTLKSMCRIALYFHFCNCYNLNRAMKSLGIPQYIVDYLAFDVE